jgi:hypothetical protein
LTHTVGLLWTSNQPVVEASTYTGQHNIETQETNTHALSGIRTGDPSNQAAADLRPRPRDCQGRQRSRHTKLKLSLALYGCDTWSATFKEEQTEDVWEQGNSNVNLPRYCHARNKGEKKHTSYSFLTLAQDGGEWLASRPGRVLLPAKGTPVTIR